MNRDINYWKTWWNLRAKVNASDYEIDRGTTPLDNEIIQHYEKQFLDSIAPKSNDLVLDAGCGTGVHLSILNSFVKEIVGMDISEEMIKRAKKRIIKERISNISLIVGNIKNIVFRNNTFDKIVCVSVLQYLNHEESEAVLKELFRVAKDNAKIVLHVKNLSSLEGLTLFFAKKIGRLLKRNVKPDCYKSNIWYEDTITRLGGQIVDYDSLGIFQFFPLPKAAVHWLQKLEMKIHKGKFIRKHGINYMITIKIKKQNFTGQLNTV